MKITGKIVRGAGRGKGLGFPTMNLDSVPSGLKFGIYAVWVFLREGSVARRFGGAASWGPRPTFNDELPVLEVFLLDFSGEAHGVQVEMEFVEKIRDIERFSSAEALSSQIQKDVAKVREILYNGAAE